MAHNRKASNALRTLAEREKKSFQIMVLTCNMLACNVAATYSANCAHRNV